MQRNVAKCQEQTSAPDKSPCGKTSARRLKLTCRASRTTVPYAINFLDAGADPDPGLGHREAALWDQWAAAAQAP